MNKRCVGILVGVVMLCAMAQASNWVTIGDPGNASQGQSNRDHSFSGGDGYGAVDYTYRVSRYQVTITEWALFYDASDIGKQGSFSSLYNHWNEVGPNAPAVRITFHQAAQYCNWLTTGSAASGAYTINSSGHVTAIDRAFRNASGLLYVLPTENEWVKAAYYDGENEKYTLYAHGADTAPPKSSDGSTGWNYDNALSPSQPWPVSSGTAEQNGTYNMMGNIWDWTEDPEGVLRGGAYYNNVFSLRSSNRLSSPSSTQTSENYGFRIVAIPEPMVVTLLGAAGMLLLIVRRLFPVGSP